MYGLYSPVEQCGNHTPTQTYTQNSSNMTQQLGFPLLVCRQRPGGWDIEFSPKLFPDRSSLSRLSLLRRYLPSVLPPPSPRLLLNKHRLCRVSLVASAFAMARAPSSPRSVPLMSSDCSVSLLESALPIAPAPTSRKVLYAMLRCNMEELVLIISPMAAPPTSPRLLVLMLSWVSELLWIRPFAIERAPLGRMLLRERSRLFRCWLFETSLLMSLQPSSPILLADRLRVCRFELSIRASAKREAPSLPKTFRDKSRLRIEVLLVDSAPQTAAMSRELRARSDKLRLCEEESYTDAIKSAKTFVHISRNVPLGSSDLLARRFHALPGKLAASNLSGSPYVIEAAGFAAERFPGNFAFC